MRSECSLQRRRHTQVHRRRSDRWRCSKRSSTRWSGHSSSRWNSWTRNSSLLWRRRILPIPFYVVPSPSSHIALDEIMDASWTEYDYTLDVPRGPSQTELEKKQKREETMRKLYENLSENYKSLTNESGWVDV